MIDRTHYIDFDDLVRRRLPDKNIPRPLFLLLRRIAHIDDINKAMAALPGKFNLEFMDGLLNYLHIHVQVFGKENLHGNDKPLIFASNHPLGGLDAVSIAHILGSVYGNKIKFYANEFLDELKPLKDMFLPIYKYGAQCRDNVMEVENFFKSENHLITFPAGATSRMRKNGLMDLAWHKNFIRKAVQYNRDVVPLFFKAQNSHFFYNLEHIRETMHLKVNIEMLFLVSELFKQQGHHFSLYIGQPIKNETFDKSKTPTDWAAYVKRIAYDLPNQTWD